MKEGDHVGRPTALLNPSQQSEDAKLQKTETFESLTKREKEVVLELLDGGRVASIAGLFGLSPRTVSNHVKAAFWKLGVHSQAELIELARTAPDKLGLDGVLSTRSQLAQSQLEQCCAQAIARLIARVNAAYVGPPALAQVRAAVRAALPLDPERRREWRDWLELKTRVDASGGPGASFQAMIDEWRDSTTRNVERLQEAGELRTDLEPSDLLRSLGALALGAGTRLLGNASRASVEAELKMLDGFVDALAEPRV
jgi:DNA-binding CsgD family transcriptional regulator/AcrR family transcriptional regulator